MIAVRVIADEIRVKCLFAFPADVLWFCCLLQGQLNKTILLQLLDDATPENKAEYRVLLSNIQTFGNL